MRTLAARLGCEAMSLYHHVEGIDGVLDGVVERLLEPLTRPKLRGGAPRSRLRSFARAYLRLAEDYPEAFPLVATRLWRTPGALAAAGRAVTLLQELGLDARAALRHARILGAYLNGAGLALAAWHTGVAAATAEAAQLQGELAPVASSINVRGVRADLDTGLERLIAYAEPGRGA